MKEKTFVKTVRTAKIIHLCILILLNIIFLTLLITHPTMSKDLFSNQTLLMLYSVTWLLVILSLVFLLYDFYKLRLFAEESHALNRAAYLDVLTGIPNRHGLDVIFQTYDTPQSLTDVGCFMVKIDNLTATNETLGRKTGDMLIQHFCSIFEKAGDGFGVVGRNGGNEFILVINHCSDRIMERFIHTLEEEIADYNREYTMAPLQIKYTYVLNSNAKAAAFTQLLTATYNKLHN